MARPNIRRPGVGRGTGRVARPAGGRGGQGSCGGTRQFDGKGPRVKR